MSRLAGRFALVDRIDKHTVVVGCLGSLHAESLTEDEQIYIAAWYIDGFPARIRLKDAEVLSDYDCPLKSNYNDFIRLTTERK